MLPMTPRSTVRTCNGFELLNIKKETISKEVLSAHKR